MCVRYPDIDRHGKSNVSAQEMEDSLLFVQVFCLV